MGVRSCFTVLFPILAACLGVACDDGAAGERQAVVVAVVAEAPGYGAVQVEKLVAWPIEVRLNGIAGVQRIRSHATTGRAVVWVDFASGTDLYKARQDTAERLQLAVAELPKVVVPKLAPVLAPDEIMLIGMWSQGGKTPPVEVRTLADSEVRPRLLAIPGVAEVFVAGGLVRQCQVIVSPDRMVAYALTISELVSAVEKALAGEKRLADTVRQGERELTLRTMGRLSELENLGGIVVASRAGRPIRLKDVARVHLSAVSPHRDASPPKGEAKVPLPPAVLLGVLRQPGPEAKGFLSLLTRGESDAKRLSREIDQALDALKPTLPGDLRLGRQLPAELAPLASQMAEEIHQDLPPEVVLRQENSADFGPVLMRKSPPRTTIAIVGPDIEQLRSVGRDLADRLRKIPGVTDVQASPLEDARQTRVKVDRKRASQLGVGVSDILTTVEVAREGRRVGRLEDRGIGRAVDVVVSFGPDVPNDAEALNRLSLKTATGETVPLAQVARFEVVSGPRTLYRQQMLRAILISCEVRAGDRAQAMAEIRRTVAAYPLPAAYHWEWD